ncbi:Ig domain-containing protein group 1 domain-containing protein [Halobacteriales archaeon QH_10_67_22]|nr:MAG: Ig domain-containing protein group 1 domain-containing protein [Halobacteriales archaeon QH_10_67_22]
MQSHTLTADERAIEGLPIRLVIALVVGVASLSVMMNTLGGIQTLGVTELDVQPEPEVVYEGDNESIVVAVVGPNGDHVSNATVIASGGTATLESVATASTNASGMATLSLSPSLGPNQDEGTVELQVKPPAGSQYADERENTEVLVLRD